MSKKKREEPQEKENSERWLLTYADLITLLLIFFIILYTISQQDKAKFETIAESLSGALRGTKAVLGESPGPSLITGQSGLQSEMTKVAQTAEQKKMNDLKQKIEALVKKEGLEASIKVSIEARGIVVRIVDQVLFPSGSADLTTNAKSILYSIGKILKTDLTQYIRIEGHTDNVPIKNSIFPSNWELSSSRANTVLRLFAEIVPVDPKYLSEVGYGEFRPIDTNSTPEGRAKNRRVEIVLLKSEFNKSEASSANQ